MKKLFIITSIVIPALASGTTQLHAARHTVSMTASVGGVCSIGAPTANTGFGTAGATLVATASGGKADAKTATLTLPYTCTSTNVSLQLTSANQGLTKTVSSVPNGQTNKMHYTAKVNVGSSAFLATLNTASATTAGPVIHSVSSGDLNLQVDIASGQASANTLVPGDYSDSLYVDVLPNP